MKNSQNSPSGLDGVKTVEKINEDQALSLINNLDLEKQPRSSENCFRFVGKKKSLNVEIDYKRNEYNLTTRGSIPKFINGENISEITWRDFQNFIHEINNCLHIDSVFISGKELKKNIQLDFNLFNLSRLELKVDIEVGIDMPYMNRFLKTNLIQHKGKPFTCEDGLTFKCKHEHYQLKIYPKSENLLRFEMIFLTRELNRYGIKTPSDITQEKIKPLGNRMKIEFAEVIMGEGINLFLADKLTKKEELLLLQFTSSWRLNCYNDTLKHVNKRDGMKYKQRMYRLRKKCRLIFIQKGIGIKKELLDQVNKKIDSCFH